MGSVNEPAQGRATGGICSALSYIKPTNRSEITVLLKQMGPSDPPVAAAEMENLQILD